MSLKVHGIIYCASRTEAFQNMTRKTSELSNEDYETPVRRKIINDVVPAHYVIDEKYNKYHLKVRDNLNNCWHSIQFKWSHNI
jgi:hypothetical protein